MSLPPTFWGPSAWTMIHTLSSTATTKEKRRLYVEWLNNLTITIPCEKCRLHFIENIKNLPVEPYSKSNVSLFYHSWKLHDIVNEQLNKPKKQRLTYEEAFEKYFGKAKVKSQMTMEEMNQEEAILQPYYSSPDDHKVEHYYEDESPAKQPKSRTYQFAVNNSNQNNSLPNSRNKVSEAPKSSKEVCHENCGAVHYQTETSNFEKFRQQDRRKFSAKNDN